MKKIIMICLMTVIGFGVSNAMAQKKQVDLKTTVLQTEVDCENCAKKIRENVSFEKGVKGLEISVEDKTVALKYDAAKTSEEKLKTSIEKLGYPVAGVVEPGCENCGHDHGHEHNHGHDHGHNHAH